VAAADRLASFAIGLRLDDVPPDVQNAAKHHLLDSVGCAIAADALGEGEAARAVGVAMGGREEATVIGSSTRLPAAGAALANGMLMHALDFDDTHADSIAHVSVVVAPAAMAAGEAAEADGRSFLAALIAGNEIVSRVGSSASGEFHARGFHPTAIAGVFGAAASAAALAGADEGTTVSAFGIAGSMASGLFAYLDAGTPTKPIHAGWAAHGGVLAAALAIAGAKGPSNVIEGRFGLYHAFLGHVPDLEAALGGLGVEWETPRIAYKPYPACHFMHGVLGAAETLEPLPADEIEDVLAIVPESAVNVVLEPVGAKLAPKTPYDAKFSLQFSLAWLLVHRSLDLSTYLPASIADPSVLELARRVRYQVREFPTSRAAFPGALEITLRDGRVVTALLDHQLGAPGNPFPDDGVRAKFRANASLGLSRANVETLEESILRIDELDHVKEAFEVLAEETAVQRMQLAEAALVGPRHL
jgi:2-methylcitrate dehydratase PrpD